jgi:hypothetical protein
MHPHNAGLFAGAPFWPRAGWAPVPAPYEAPRVDAEQLQRWPRYAQAPRPAGALGLATPEARPGNNDTDCVALRSSGVEFAPPMARLCGACDEKPNSR